MKANLIVSAPNLSKAEEYATTAFKDFFGDEPFEIVEESAESQNAVQSMQGEGFRVVSWRCEFVAASRPVAA